MQFHHGDQLGQGTAISATDTVNTVAFTSQDANLDSIDGSTHRRVFVIQVPTLTINCVSHSNNGDVDGDSWGPSISDNGRYIAYVSEADNIVAGVTSGTSNIFVHDLQQMASAIVPASPIGNANSWEAQISGNGAYVGFTSDAGNFVGDDNNASDVFRYTIASGNLARMSIGPSGMQSNGDSWDMAVSGDGLTMAYTSLATNLTTPPTLWNRELYLATLNQ